jgi:hypothetical protein
MSEEDFSRLKTSVMREFASSPVMERRFIVSTLQALKELRGYDHPLGGSQVPHWIPDARLASSERDPMNLMRADSEKLHRYY